MWICDRAAEVVHAHIKLVAFPFEYMRESPRRIMLLKDKNLFAARAVQGEQQSIGCQVQTL